MEQYGNAGRRMLLYRSLQDVPRTMEAIERELKNRGIPVFARFNHEANAAGAGLQLRPTRVIAFGAPATGTRLMQQNQAVALELPLRMAVWEDEDGSVFLSTPNLETLAAAYGLTDLDSLTVVEKMRGLLDEIAEKAANPAPEDRTP